MKYIYRNFQRVILGTLASMMLLAACRTSNVTSNGLVIRKYVNWQLTFRKNTTRQEQATALVAIDKFILDYLRKEDFLVRDIRIIHNISRDLQEVAIIVDVTGQAATGAVSTLKPRPPGPRRDLLNLSPAIEEIKNIDASGRAIEMDF